MSLLGKVETDVQVKVAANKFHDVFACRPHHVSNMTPGNIQGCELHEGEFGKSGTVICWNYVHGKFVSLLVLSQLIGIY